MAIDATVRVYDRRVHTIGDVWCAVANNGSVGSGHEMSVPFSPDTTSLLTASFEFPAGSSREHLYSGGLWVGGLIGTDTLVSAAVNAVSILTEDFASYSRLTAEYDPASGLQTLVTTYSDTNFASKWKPRPGDPGLVGVEVRHTTRSFESPPYDRFVIVEYLVRNIRKEPIRKIHMGFFADADAFNTLRTDQREEGAEDDVSGFLPEDAIAYAIDNDGDWLVNQTGEREHNWCPSGLAIAPIYFDPAPSDTSFNWWDPGWTHIDWGPSSSGSRDTSAIPRTPGEQYRAMANSEIDFDQIFTTLNRSNPQWKPFPFRIGRANDIANGMDTRWLISFGFGDLAPNDSVRLVLALLVGDSILQSPEQWDPETGAESFYSRLSFTDLKRNLSMARWAWANEFELYGAAPTRIQIIPTGDSAIECTWNPPPYHTVLGYRAYRRVAGDSAWTHIREYPASVRAFADYGLKPRESYEYAISAIDWNDQEGSLSRPVKTTMGRPVASPQISATNTPDQIRVDWALPPQGSAFSDYSILKLYRRAEDSSDYTLYRTIPITTRPVGSDAQSAAVPIRGDPFSMSPSYLIDDSITPGVMYHYRATLTNDLGLEGPYSSPDSAFPMPLDRKGLVVLHTYGQMVNINTLRAFYGTWAERSGFDTTTPISVQIPPVDVGPPRTMRDIPVQQAIQYRCLVMVCEDPGITPLSSPTFYDKLDRYLANGGKIVLIHRNVGTGIEQDGLAFPLPILDEYLGVHRTRTERASDFVFTGPRVAAVARVYFQSAQPVAERYTAVYGDSVLGWSVLGIPRDRLVDSSLLAGYTPSVGSLDSLSPDTEVLYRYQSAYPTSIYHDQPIAVERITDSTAAVLFNFPLSLMKHEQAWQALTQAVADLGVDTTNYWRPPASTTRSMIEWLYGRSSGNPDPKWDKNRDGVIDIRDIVIEVKR